MSDDLDDGEIPKETTFGHVQVSTQSDKPTQYEPAQSAARIRYNDRTSPDHPRRSHSRSRPGYKSPSREDVYARRRPRSPRESERHPSDTSSVRPRARPSINRREPSVRDANTRADLGRLAREAEAAAYKARTAAVNKNSTIGDKRGGRSDSASPRRIESMLHSERSASISRKRSRSPLRATIPPRDDRREDDRRRRSPSRPTSTYHSLSARSPPQHRKPVSQARRSSPEATRSGPPVRKGLTAADIGRLEREKEAAAYKAQVLAEQKGQTRTVEAPFIRDSPAQLERRVTATSVQDHQLSSTERKQEKPPEKVEVVRHVRSVCPKLDSQLAIMKREYELLLKEDLKKQAEMRMCKRRWSILERESQREAYKSELAQLSLEATSAM